jgi:translation initiation factor IF-2
LAATRVYILAKELGVKSSAIVKKCQNEGLDVKNHMSAISAGLAATIREWFSEGENITTIETATKVDLKKVRIRKKKTVKKAKPKAPEDQDTTQATTAAAQTGPASAVIDDKEAPSEDSAAIEDIATQIPEAPPEPSEVKPIKKKKAKKAKPPKPVEKKPKKPEPILPAGPMLEKPKPAKLNGPTVVRIEEPESLRPRRPRSKPRYEQPLGEPLMSAQEDVTGGNISSGRGKKPGTKRGRASGRRQGEDSIEDVKKGKIRHKWRQRDLEERQARLDAAGGEGTRVRPSRKIVSTASHAAALVRPKEATISEPITIKSLSSALAVKASDIIAKLVQQGIMVTANQTITSEVAELAALEFDTELTVESKPAEKDQIAGEFDNRERKHLKKRPVVAAMLGHVDHGKTSLLDKIRSTQVAAGEAGGITQHIGASQITLNDSVVTFLDTPGHEAFTAMRARGANMTDVVVLVVAADDGVMPQTVEAISHSKAADVPIIVALNKIDLPGCDINRIYAQLAEHGLTPTEWGGDTEVVKTSAQTGEGIEDLMEHIDYIAELQDLQADDTIPATGWVIEARMSTKRGPIATLLIKEGCLKKGDVILAGTAFGRVKILRNSFGKNIKSATSSMPVEVMGLNDVPQASDRFYCLDDINRAKNAAEENQVRSRENTLAQRSRVTLDNLFSHIEAGNVKELKLIVKADVQGSVDVLKKYLSELSTEEVKIHILHAAPGGITEGDILLGETSNAIIIGFNVVADERATKIAETKNVDIRLYNVIYRITEDLEKSMAGLLEPEEKENTLGRAAVRATFKVSQVGTVAGCYVTTGLASKHAKVRLIRDNIVLRDNMTIDSLKHFKDDVREVKTGFECGVKIAGYDDIKVDDILEFYEIVKISRSLK